MQHVFLKEMEVVNFELWVQEVLLIGFTFQLHGNANMRKNLVQQIILAFNSFEHKLLKWWKDKD